MYQALYRKYRPQKFDDVVGQNVVVKTLCNAIKNNKISHAYLFAGPRGTGKTSIAKIFAKTVNCENLVGLVPCNKCDCCLQFNNKQSVDIIEIDAASNNGVEEIREIKNRANLVPTNGKYKIYIIDEVHMLTTAAFNAMLKILEEPPKNVIFILATTEPHKIPLTILSRCQRFDFKRLSNNEIVNRLKYITKEEKINIEDNCLEMIAEISNGGMRDSIGLLDQLMTYCEDKITLNDIHEINGSINDEQIYAFTMQLIEKNYSKVYEMLDKYNNEGKNLTKIVEEIIELLKNVLIYINCSNYFQNQEQIEKYFNLYQKISEKEICVYIDVLLETLKNIKIENNKKLIIELAIVKLGNMLNAKDNVKVEQNNKNDEISQMNIGDKSSNKEILSNIDKIKKIRINNTLSNFNKRELLQLKERINEIKKLINIPEYSSTISLILDGELKACGKENLIFVYNNESLENYFNLQIILIEKIFREVFNVKYKVIGVNKKQWDEIKKIFNDSIKNNKKVYIYQQEDFDVEELLNISNNGKEFVKNDIDNMFAEIVEYS